MSKKEKKLSVGGQALIEGVMMRGPEVSAMAVRIPNGTIDVEEWENEKPSKLSKIPVLRGIVNFVTTLTVGYSCLSKSAEKAGLEDDSEEEMSKFECFLEEKFGDKIMKFVIVLGVILGVLAAICMFMLLPSLITKGIEYLIPLGGWKAAVEGVIKIIVFVVYLALVAKMKDIRRVFEYHGAEHKTIFCYEAKLPLTIENVKKQRRFHPRCGTSFMIIILILSILVFSLPIVPWNNLLLRTGIKLLMLPVILGIAYEFIKLAGRHNNLFTRIISWPGLKVQHLTTKEPDEQQIEVAIASLLPCLPKEEREFFEVKPLVEETEEYKEENVQAENTVSEEASHETTDEL